MNTILIIIIELFAWMGYFLALDKIKEKYQLEQNTWFTMGKWAGFALLILLMSYVFAPLF